MKGMGEAPGWGVACLDTLSEPKCVILQVLREQCICRAARQGRVQTRAQSCLTSYLRANGCPKYQIYCLTFLEVRTPPSRCGRWVSAEASPWPAAGCLLSCVLPWSSLCACASLGSPCVAKVPLLRRTPLKLD